MVGKAGRLEMRGMERLISALPWCRGPRLSLGAAVRYCLMKASGLNRHSCDASLFGSQADGGPYAP